jgi:hypothetical protein
MSDITLFSKCDQLFLAVLFSPPFILLSCRCQISLCSPSASFQILCQFILDQTYCQHCVCNWWHQSQQQGGITNYWSLEGGLGSSCVAYIFVFLVYTIICRLFKLSPSDQPKVILQLRIGPFWFSVKIFGWSTRAVGPKKFFSLWPKITLGGHGWQWCLTDSLTNWQTNQPSKSIEQSTYEE